MKIIAYILVIIFSLNGFFSTFFIAQFIEKSDKFMVLYLMENNHSEQDDSLPPETSFPDENTESKNSQEGSETFDFLKELFAGSDFFQFQFISSSLNISLQNSLPSYPSEVIIPPPEFSFI